MPQQLRDKIYIVDYATEFYKVPDKELLPWWTWKNVCAYFKKPTTQFLISIIYFGLGCLAYYTFEGWGILESVYFIVNTFTTCGLSNFGPNTFNGQWFTLVHVLVGLAIMYPIYTTRIQQFFSAAESGFIRKIDSRKKIHAVTKFFFELVFMVSVMLCFFLLGGLYYYTREKHWEYPTKSVWDVVNVTNSSFFNVTLNNATAVSSDDGGTSSSGDDWDGFRGWTFVDAVYFCIVCSSGVGYGDLLIPHGEAEVATLLYIIFSLIVSQMAIEKMAYIFFASELIRRDEVITYH